METVKRISKKQKSEKKVGTIVHLIIKTISSSRFEQGRIRGKRKWSREAD